MDISTTGLSLLTRFEGLRLKAYRDEAGIWTIGYGHIRDVVEGMTITGEQAVEMLRQDVASTVAFVNRAIGDVPTSQNQFDALTTLCYNIGVGSFRSSSILKDHRAGNYLEAANGFLFWDLVHKDGKLVESNGLDRRRFAERLLYLTP